MYTPHTVSVSNLISEDTTTFVENRQMTVLSGVFLDISKMVNINTLGLVATDTVVLYIPLDIVAKDASTEQIRTYLPPKQYEAAADKSAHWTLDTNSFFVKGEISSTADFQTINAQYDNAFKIVRVDLKDFGTPDMQHWEVKGA